MFTRVKRQIFDMPPGHPRRLDTGAHLLDGDSSDLEELIFFTLFYSYEKEGRQGVTCHTSSASCEDGCW